MQEDREQRKKMDTIKRIKAREVLDYFEEYLPKFKKIIPEDYKSMLQLSSQFEEQGMSREEAQIEAFYERIGKKH